MKKIKINIIPVLITVLLIGGIIAGTFYLNNQKLERETYNNEVQNKTKMEEKINNIDEDDTNDAENKVTVYVLHAGYCQFCRNSLAFFNELVEKYDYLEVKTYQLDLEEENDNLKLYDAIAKYFDNDTSYIPYIIIGDIYNDTGFGDSTKELIEKAIQKSHTSTLYQDVVAKVIKENKDYKLIEETIKKK